MVSPSNEWSDPIMKRKSAEVSFTVSASDTKTIRNIVARAVDMGLVRGRNALDHWYDRLTCEMDLTATHANGNALRLQDFLDADDFNFTHDIAGIARHIDRETGRLTNHFRPRFSRPASIAA
jgi:hypothetical protein